MSEPSASDEHSPLIREPLAEEGSLGAADTSSHLPDAAHAAHAALTAPRLSVAGDSEQATERQPRRGERSRSGGSGGGIGAIVTAALVVALMSFALLHLVPASPGSRQDTIATATSGVAFAPTATATTSATATAAPTATRAPSGSSHGTSNGASGGTRDNFTIESISAISINADSDSATGMTATSNSSGASFTGGCGPHVYITLNFTLTLSALPQPGMTIDYYVRHSDGSSDGTLSQPVEPTWGSPATSNTLTTASEWTIPYTQATGAPQWVELDVLSPNPLTERMDFTTNCPFTSSFPQVSASPTRYDCTTGGSQAFTVSGTLTASLTADKSPHTVTYQWQRADGTVSPDQSVTFTPGVTAMPIPSDTASITFQTSSVAPDNAYIIDRLVVTDANGHTIANEATIRSTC